MQGRKGKKKKKEGRPLTARRRTPAQPLIKEKKGKKKKGEGSPLSLSRCRGGPRHGRKERGGEKKKGGGANLPHLLLIDYCSCGRMEKKIRGAKGGKRGKKEKKKKTISRSRIPLLERPP